MSRVRIAAVVVLAGGLAGVAVAYVGSASHRAVTTMAVQRGGAPAVVPTVVDLARTAVLWDNVADATHVPSASVERHLHARALPHTALIELTYDDPSAAHAAQLVQQAASTLESLVASRFPAVRVAVVDPAHPESGTRRPVARDALAGVLLGVLLGGAGLVWPARRPRAARPKPVPAPKPVPDVPVAVAHPPEPEPEPEPEPAPSGPLAELRAALAVYGPEFGGDQVAEWEAYLDAFEAQIVNGELPPRVAGLADDVFGPLRARLERANG